MNTETYLVNSELDHPVIISNYVLVSGKTKVIDIIAELGQRQSFDQLTKKISKNRSQCYVPQHSNCVFVIENDQLVGIITAGDLVRLATKAPSSLNCLIVSEVMTQPVITLEESAFTDCLSAMTLLQQHSIQHLPIVDSKGKLLGLVTQASLQQQFLLLELLQWREVSNVMNQQVTVVSAQTSLSAIAQQLANQNQDLAVIVKSDRIQRFPVGIITKEDFVQFLASGLNLEQYTADSVINSPLVSVQPTDSLGKAQELMAQQQRNQLLVTGEQGELIGVVTENSFLEALNPMEVYQLAHRFQGKSAEQAASKTATLEANAEREHLLRKVTDQIRSSLDLQEILDKAVENFRLVLNCDRAIIYQYHGDETGTVVAKSQLGEELSQSNPNLHHSCLSSEWLNSCPQGKARVIHPLDETNFSQSHQQLLLKLDSYSALMVPIVIAGQRWGWIIASSGNTSYCWQSDQVDFLEQLSMPLAVAIEQATLYQQTQRELEARREAEASLKFRERRFRGIFDNMFQLMGLLSPDGILLEVNQTALNFAGVNREAVVGRPFWETYWWQISPATQADLQDAIHQASQGQFIRYEVDVWGADQRVITIDFSLRPVHDEQGEIILLIPEGRDLTEAKQLQSEREQACLLLDKMRRRYACLVEASPVGIFRSDLSGNCIYASEICCEILGLSQEAMKKRGWQQALHPEDKDQVMAAWSRAVQEKRPFQMEYRLERPNGTVRWVYGQTAAERDSQGQVNGFVGTITDINDRATAETALKNIIAGTATTTGENFFPALVCHVAQALNVSHVLVSALVDEQLQTLAFWNNGEYQPQFIYPWRKTPCESSLQQGAFYCQEFVQQQFPEAPGLVKLGVTSYLGVALYDGEGHIIGNLCIMDREPLPDPEPLTNILHIFASRAALVCLKSKP